MAGPSLTEVCNRALLKLGAPRISSIDDGTAEAMALSAALPTVRRKLLRLGAWAFATTRATLSADAAPPAWGWSLAYGLPADFVRLVQVGDDPAWEPARELEGGRILTDEPAPLRLRYVRDVAEPALWDPAFVECVASALAHECCEKVTQSAGRKAALARELGDALRDARRCNAVEVPPAPLPEHQPWQRARYGGGPGDPPVRYGPAPSSPGGGGPEDGPTYLVAEG